VVFTNTDLVCTTGWIYIICLAWSHRGQKRHCMHFALLTSLYITLCSVMQRGVEDRALEGKVGVKN